VTTPSIDKTDAAIVSEDGTDDEDR